MVDEILTAYAGARVTKLVNRQNILRDVKKALEDSTKRNYVFYLEADGGTGKTFLARHVLRLCQEKGDWAHSGLKVAKNEIDLYHYQSRSIDGFMAAFVDAFPGDGGCFSAYKEQRQYLQEVRENLVGAVTSLKEQQDLLRKRFLEGCQVLGEQSERLVVVLDTAERLIYETDRIQQQLDLGKGSMDVRTWLLEKWLPAMRNAVILVCGRPREKAREPFAADLKVAVLACDDTVFKAPPLEDFTLDETMQYIDAVRETAEEDKNLQAMQRLDAISPDSRRVIHTLTGGRPITLALIVDYYLVTERLLDELKVSMEELEALGEEEIERRREKVKIEIVRLFREIGRPADQAIVNLAWAPMGMDADLLSRVAEIEPVKAQRILDTLSDPRRGLSFVKIRPTDKRAFLHDEMYKLMQDYVLSMMPGRAGEVYDKILAYYEEEILEKEEMVQDLHLQQSGRPRFDERGVPVGVTKTEVDVAQLAAALAELDDLRVEEVFYRLRHDPLDGFAQYCEYAEAAITSNNDNLDTQLRDQMLTFMRDRFKEADEVSGLRREAVERDSALRWGWRSVYAANADDAYRLVNYLRNEEPDFLKAGGKLALAELDIIEGWAAGFSGTDIPETEGRLKAAVTTLLHFQPTSDFDRLRLAVLLAQAYMVLGYLLRVQGHFEAASKIYRSALPLWRDLKREADHAEVLNNLAWAYAESGNFRRALRCCGSGLDLREKLGYRYLIALSYNTLGLIEIKNDQPHRGLVHCEQALTMFRELGRTRGMGLAYTALAEAYRRSAATRRLYPPAEQLRRLRQAEKFAKSAVEIFTGEVREKLRLVEALNELGCIYRNWSTIPAEYYAEDDPTQEELVSLGKQALRGAADAAEGVFEYRQVDALVNLAWLNFYAHGPGEQVDEVLAEVEQIIGAEYRIIRSQGLPRPMRPMPFFWVQLSKLRVLYGRMAMYQYWQEPAPERGQVRNLALLEKATEHFTLALAYSELFADDYRDMRAAKDSIYDEFSRANIHELQAIYQAVKDTAMAYDLGLRPATRDKPARPRIRNFLEENFGTVEEMAKGPTWVQQ